MLSYNEQTGETEIKTVTQTFTSSHKEVVKVTHSGGQTITSSLGHRYFTQRGWIGAEDLRAGDILQLVNGETVIVEQVQHELLENSETLYNFSVDGNHNYYVAESVDVSVYDFVLAHNKGCGDYSHIKENDYRATINAGESELPHAHIFKKRENIGRIFINGTMDDSLLKNKKALDFVKRHKEEIIELIINYYGKL